MTPQERDLIRHALETLRRLLPNNEPRAGDPAPRRCPVTRFAQGYLAHNPASDVSCSELWTFYREISDAGELPPMCNAAFLRQLPAAMEAVFCLRKCHHIERAGRRVRGFRGVGIRLDAAPPDVLEVEPEAE